jgi:hypothetical protein
VAVAVINAALSAIVLRANRKAMRFSSERTKVETCLHKACPLWVGVFHRY